MRVEALLAHLDECTYCQSTIFFDCIKIATFEVAITRGKHRAASIDVHAIVLLAEGHHGRADVLRDHVQSAMIREIEGLGFVLVNASITQYTSTN